MRLLIDDEDAVGVAVECQANIGAQFEHPGLQVDQVFWLDRVCWMVRKGPIELGKQMVNSERQICECSRCDQAAHAIGRIDDDLERFQRVDIDEAVEMSREVHEHIVV